MVVLTGIVAIAITYPWSRAVEGRRQARNRLMTLLIVFAFSLAVLPLLSLLYEVFSRGLHAFNVDFLTTSARGAIGAEGGAEHAILGTLIITAIATVISVPIGLMAAIYLNEYGGQSRLRQGADLLRRRDDGDPVDRRGAVRLRAVRALPRALASGWGSWGRSRSRS